MIILGIDPGTNRVGYGVIETEPGDLAPIAYGCVDLKSDKENNLLVLKTIYHEVSRLIQKYKPEVVAIEKLFFFKNKKTVIEVAQARGVIALAALEYGALVREFTPLQVKQAVSAYGLADKKAVQKMVKIILKLKDEPKPDDVADALAVAICCANSRSF